MRPFSGLETLNLPKLAQELQLSNAKDWKLLVPKLRENESLYKQSLQTVLDIMSPIKSPTNASLVSPAASTLASPLKSTTIGYHEEYSIDPQAPLLGEGISKVKLAKHGKTGALVAIKVLEKAQMKQHNFNIVTEVMLLGGLYHPHINPILQVIDSESHVYLVMKLERGGDLFSLIQKRERIPEPEAAVLFSQLVSAVDYIHQQGIVHRDLKPENILLDEHGRVKLCDFGFANLMQSDKPFEEFCGSPEYAAPEMVGRKTYLGPEVDIWSLGVILFVMITGFMPFGELNKAKLYLSIMTAKYKIPDFVSLEASDLISKIIVPQVSSRATLSQIKSHSWLKENQAVFAIDYSSKSSITIPTYIHKRLIELGYEENDIQEYKQQAKPGSIKAATYLLEEITVPREFEDPNNNLKRKSLHINTLEDPVKSQKQDGLQSPSSAYKAMSPISEKFESIATSPLAQIKQGFHSSTVEVDSEMDLDQSFNTTNTASVPITATFQHSSNRKKVHTIILERILKLGGRIPYFHEFDQQIMIIQVPMTKKSVNSFMTTFNQESHDDVDMEIAACFVEPIEKEVIRASVTTSTVTISPPQSCTVFQLLPSPRKGGQNEYSGWIYEEFDCFAQDLVKDIA